MAYETFIPTIWNENLNRELEKETYTSLTYQ